MPQIQVYFFPLSEMFWSLVSFTVVLLAYFKHFVLLIDFISFQSSQKILWLPKSD